MHMWHAEKFNKYQKTFHLSALGKTRRQEISEDTPLMHIFSLTVESKSAVNRALDEIVSLYKINVVHTPATNHMMCMHMWESRVELADKCRTSLLENGSQKIGKIQGAISATERLVKQVK